MSRNYSSIVFFLFVLISALLRSKGTKGKKTGAQQGSQSPAQSARQTPAQARAPGRGTAAAKASAADAVHWRTARDAECAYGEANHRYSHNADRRVAQLDGYLKAGLIDRKEYSQMLERYQRMDREAGID